MRDPGWNPRLSEPEIIDMVRALVAAGHLRDGAVLVHDLDRVRANHRALRAAFPPGTLHAFAVKANPLIALLRALVDEGAGLEAASIEEVHVALAAGCPAARIVYDAPAKTVPELREALALGVRINSDNADELARIASLRGRCPTVPGPIGLRVNPAVGEGAIADTSVAGARSRFGVAASVEVVGPLVRRFPFLSGLHVHVGSQGCPLALLADGGARVASLAAALAPWRPTWIDLGGGLPARYDSAAASPPSPTDYVAALGRVAPSLLAGELELVTEFGRAPLAGCGFAVSAVAYVKHVDGAAVAVIGVGADLLLRAAYRPDVWRHELMLLDAEGRPREGDVAPTVVAGPLCFAGDVVGRCALPPPRPGDIVVIRDTGAYTLSLWSRHCSRAMPLALGHDARGFTVLRRRETVEDVVNLWR